MKGKQLINLLSYIAVALIAVALILGKLLGWLINPQVLAIMNLVAQIVAYTITAIFAFNYAKSKRNMGWMIAYIVFVIAIIVFTILNFV